MNYTTFILSYRLTGVLYYENFDLNKLITPVKADRLNQLLIETGYPEQERKLIYDGFTK